VAYFIPLMISSEEVKSAEGKTVEEEEEER
jgi:hypothetical protein